MKKLIRKFWQADAGQTLTEYALLLVFLLLAVVGLAINFQSSVAGVNAITNNNLIAASSVIN
jgi:Flp pilus assembly pilin Flp